MCKVCVNILISKKDNRPWEDQKKDWTMVPKSDVQYKYKYLKKDELDLSYSDKKEVSMSCICGHEIVKSYYVYNNKRKLCYLLGSSCIYTCKKKVESGAFAGCEEIKTQLKDLKKIHCDICNISVNHKRYITHCSSPRHKQNLRKKNYRQCKHCKLYNIEKTKPSYYHSCLDCFKLNKEKKKVGLNYKVSSTGEKRFGFL